MSNFAEVFSTDDSKQRWATTNVIDNVISDTAEWHPRLKKQVLLRQLQTLVSQEEKDEAKKNILSAEFKFFATLLRIMDKYPQTGNVGLDHRFIINDYTNVNWSKILPHIDPNIIEQEVMAQTNFMEENLHQIRRMMGGRDLSLIHI